MSSPGSGSVCAGDFHKRIWEGRGWLLLAVIAVGTLAATATGQDRPPAKPATEPKADGLNVTEPKPANPRTADPTAENVFEAMSARLAEAKQFSFENRAMIDRVLDTGLRVQYSRRSRVLVRRPGALAASTVGDVEDMGYWYSNGKLTMLDRRTNTYAQVDVPQTIDEMFDHMAAQYGLVVPLCDLLFSNPRKACLEHVYMSVYVGLHEVDGVRCHHLAFRQPGVDWQIWIAEGAEPLPQKVVITYKDMPGSPQFIALLDKWDLANRQADKAFVFTPPDGAKRIELAAPGKAEDGKPARPAGQGDPR